MAHDDDSAVTASHPALGVAGLSTEEEAAYELLVDRPSAAMHQLAAIWTRPESLQDVLAALEDKGLVIQDGRNGHYAAAAPDVAVEALLQSREQRLRDASSYVTHLAATYEERGVGREPADVVEVVTGHRAVRHRLTQVQRSARDAVRCLDKPRYLDQSGTAAATLGILEHGISHRTIYERASIEVPGSFPEIERLIEAGGQARVVATLPMKLYLVDGRLAFLPLQQKPASAEAAVIVHPSGLLDALSELFEGLWQRALPLNLGPGVTRSATARPRVTVDDERLIALLLSGLTDQAIARQLGIGHRTVQRRVAALTEQLGARTRFQAGVQAAFRHVRRDAATDH